MRIVLYFSFYKASQSLLYYLDYLNYYFFKLFPMYLFVQLHQALVVACRIFSCSMRTLWQVGAISLTSKSQPLDHQGSPSSITLNNKVLFAKDQFTEVT